MTTAMIPEETSFHDNPGNDMRRPGERIVLDDDDDSDESQDDDDFDPSTPKNNLSVRTKSKKNRKSSLGGGNGPGGVPPSSAKRRRRRSSARFLKLGDTEGDDENSSNGSQPTSLDNLGEVYQKAIRMNAENRINAANSWNLNLIDHLDRFVAPELRTKTSLTMEDTLSAATGVNFTKASCTLDASVKIYSYRVDDVHLTSYKVLANLNRTDTKEDGGKKSKKQSDEGNALEESSQSQRKGNAAGNVDTLEHNLCKCHIHENLWLCIRFLF
jgi:condensin complex subunit 2